MIYAISPIKYGDNVRSRLSGIGLRGELVFRDFIKESAMSCVGSETHEQ